MSSTSLALSLFIHLVATVVWIGGLLITLFLVWPAARKTLDSNPALYGLLSRLRRRFNPVSNLALVALIVTGLFQMTANPNYNGFMAFDNNWSKIMLVKHIVVGLMALAGLMLQYGVTPALERTTLMLQHMGESSANHAEWLKLHKREQLFTWANGLLGLAVLAFSAWLGAL